ncbi:MAG: hypothetical protein IPN38_05285 [Flavobacteriales bacterium]|nr:hypothetical protein [Flavobacteriales bacterium]
MPTPIDTTFDFRSDTPTGKDPDTFSRTLRSYHKLLWSKPLPSGRVFTLDDSTPSYLLHRSELGEFVLASDTVIPSFWRERRIAHIVAQIPREDVEAFNGLGYTIGGMMLFPGNRIEGKMTINGARGCHPLIKDRFDLTVECIRRHYLGEPSPLQAVLARYAAFFKLFGDFPGYAKHFLLHDLVTDDLSAVRFFTPFAGFATSPLPASVDAYQAYRQQAMDFLNARNQRIIQAS